MDYEIKAAAKKLEAEQKARLERTRRRLEQERKAKDEAKRRQEAFEEEHRKRRLADAVAAEAARKKLEDEISAGQGIRFTRRLRTSLLPGHNVTSSGDKITLPQSVLADLQMQGALDKGPIFFEIVTSEVAARREAQTAAEAAAALIGPGDRVADSQEEATGRTHAGVLEFTSEEGFVGLPRHVANCLWGQDLGELGWEGRDVVVKYVRLSKGTYAKLQPAGNTEFADVANHKAALETALRTHATLTVGDVLVVRHGGVDYELRVVELRPAPQVTVIDTDMEVDIEPTVERAEVLKRSELKIGAAPVSGEISEGNTRFFRFPLDSASASAITEGTSNLVITLEGSGEGADADLYVAAHPNLHPNPHSHQFSSHDVGTKTVIISGDALRTLSPTDGQLSFGVGVHGYKGTTKFRLSVTLKEQETKGQKLGGSGAAEALPGAGYTSCPNCGQTIPAASAVLHGAYCRRHNAVCPFPGCGLVLRRDEMKNHVHCEQCGKGLAAGGELEKHVRVHHTPLKCECGAELVMEDMVRHKAEDCPLRSIMCRFCGDLVPAGGVPDDYRDRIQGLSAHEASCGSRTATCEDCGRSIMLKNFDVHRAAVHGQSTKGSLLPQLPVETPIASREAGTAASSGPASVECPVCGRSFSGSDAQMVLNRHLDEHFNPAPSEEKPTTAVEGGRNGASTSEDVEMLDPPVVPPISVPNDALRRRLDVECPICGESVHSERDLSMHIDAVH